MQVSKEIIRAAHTVSLGEPENYNAKDLKHFRGCLELSIAEISLTRFINAEVNQLQLFDRGRIVRTHCMMRQNDLKLDFKAHVKRVLFKKRNVDNAIWVLNNFSLAYFHWFTEVLPRILLAEEGAGKLPVLIPDVFLSRAFIRESLDVFDVKVVSYHLRETIKVRNLLAPSQSEPAFFDAVRLQGVRKRFQQFDGFNSNGYRLLYVSRKYAFKRKVVNEDELEKLLGRYGVETVYMENLSFSEQRKLMSETCLLISNHGAGITNILFMPEQSVVLELKSDADNINNCYFKMARALGTDYYYTINEGNDRDIQKADIKVDLASLEQLMEVLISKMQKSKVI